MLELQSRNRKIFYLFRQMKVSSPSSYRKEHTLGFLLHLAILRILYEIKLLFVKKYSLGGQI